MFGCLNNIFPFTKVSYLHTISNLCNVLTSRVWVTRETASVKGKPCCVESKCFLQTDAQQAIFYTLTTRNMEKTSARGILLLFHLVFHTVLNNQLFSHLWAPCITNNYSNLTWQFPLFITVTQRQLWAQSKGRPHIHKLSFICQVLVVCNFLTRQCIHNLV